MASARDVASALKGAADMSAAAKADMACKPSHDATLNRKAASFAPDAESAFEKELSRVTRA